MRPRRHFAACTRGLEPALVDELTELGAAHVTERRGGVAFEADKRLAYTANLWLRSAIRVQEELVGGRMRDADDLYDAVASVPWTRYIHPDQTLAVSASVRDAPSLRHSGYAALRVKDAVVDVVRAKHGRRPSVDTKFPDLALKLVVHGSRLLLYRDLSGRSLHKRGWRPVQVKSPLNEATAAGLLRLTGWDRESPLLDPLCGSGTLPIEAALWAADRAPGLQRPFAFEQFPDHDERLWEELLDDARRRAKPTLPFAIDGADRHDGALTLAAEGARAAGAQDLVRFTRSDIHRLEPDTVPRLVVTNPPYGERLGEGEDLIDTYRDLGKFLKAKCPGATAWILSGNRELTKHLGMRTSRRVPVMNGPIECRWLRYEILERRNGTSPTGPASS
ncbi:MAG: THUMP domain-containing protein [Planctomycetota bacterium]|nr:THUMP domain-containing protein [Planctomycetota bacterium]